MIPQTKLTRLSFCFYPLSFYYFDYHVKMASSLSNNIQKTNTPKPINPSFWPDRYPAKECCSKCGLCETTFIQNVTTSCAFINGGMKRNLDKLEPITHGRSREIVTSATALDDRNDEKRFGVMTRPILLGRGVGIEDAQWTGCVTAIAKSMLTSKLVDAVVCISSKDGDWSNPEPIIARTVDDVLKGRGVKPGVCKEMCNFVLHFQFIY